MARVAFVVPSVLNSGGGERKIELGAATLREALAAATAEMGEEFARRILEDPKADVPVPRALVNLYVNGKNAQFTGGLDTALSDGDEVYLLPAVAGGEDLPARDLDRYSRQVMLDGIGYEGQVRLRGARACIVGAGGLGHPIAARLVGMGVGRVRLVDRDTVELSNLHRQALFTEADVGRVKVEAAAERLRAMNSGVEVEAVAASVSAANAASIVEGCDVVVDALDSVNARYALNRACVAAGIPFVSGAAVGTAGQALTVVPEKTACYHCVFPALNEDEMPTCSIEGVNPAVLSVVGGIEAAEAARVLVGREPALAGRMLHVDIDTMAFSSTRTFRADECPVCGTDRVAVKVPGGVAVEELCGRNKGQRTFALAPPAGKAPDLSRAVELAKSRGIRVEQTGKMGWLFHFDSEYLDGWRGDGKRGAFTLMFVLRDANANFTVDGSAVIVGARDEEEAVWLYNYLLGRDGEALRGLEKAVSEDPSNAMAHRLKSRTLVSMKKYGGALEAAKRAVSLDPKNPRSHKSVANALHALARFKEALDSLDAAIALDADDADSRSNRASVLVSLGRHAEALEAAERAIALDRGHVWAHANKAEALCGLGRQGEAIGALEDASKLFPRDRGTLLDLADLCEDMDLADKARSARERAEALGPALQVTAGGAGS